MTAYALEISRGHNLKNLPRLSVKTVKNYLRAAASHAEANGQQDPRYRYTPAGLPLDGAKKFFPMLGKLLSHMSKWAAGRDEALPLTAAILNQLHIAADAHGPSSEASCIFDAVCLGLQTGSRCSEYCRGSPTDPTDSFSKVPSSHYAGAYAGFPIAFIPADFTFLSASQHFIPHTEAQSSAVYVRVRFRFDKGGTGNMQERTFKRFSKASNIFCPLAAVLRALSRWESCDLDPLTPLFCHVKTSQPIFLQDSAVTKHLRAATLRAYPDPTHFYHKRLKDVRTHSLRVIACLILVIAQLSTPTIEHRLRWASTAWKVYVRESLSHVSQASASAFFTALGDSTQAPVPDYIPQAFDSDDLL